MKTHGHLDFTLPRMALKSPTEALLIPLLSLTLSACAFSENPGGPPPPKKENVIETLQGEKDKEAQNGILTEQNVSVEFVENPTPGSYKLIVRWPKAIEHVTVKVNDRLPLILRKTNSAEFDVQDDTVQKIQIVSYGLVSPAPLSSVELEARSPNDTIIDGELNLKNSATITGRRLFILKAGRIRTNGFDLTIDVEKFAVEKDSSFERATTPMPRKAHISTRTINEQSAGDSTLKGSQISITAKEAVGDLIIAMIGVNGKPGLPGIEVEKSMSPIPSRAAPVNAALNGRDGIETMTGTACRAGGVGSDTSGCGRHLGCTTPPTSGSDGPAGAIGTAGGRGGDGGSFGILDVSIENSNQFKIDVGTMNGLPGSGGEGAPGFPGTLGGNAGATPGSCSHYKVSGGAQGSTGPKGPQGPSGGVTPGSNIRGGRTPINVFEISR